MIQGIAQYIRNLRDNLNETTTSYNPNINLNLNRTNILMKLEDIYTKEERGDSGWEDDIYLTIPKSKKPFIATTETDNANIGEAIGK